MTRWTALLAGGLLAAGALAVASCGGDDTPILPTTSPVSPFTEVTVAPAPSSTDEAGSTGSGGSASPAPTPAEGRISLGPDGIGVASFGDGTEDTIAAVDALIGTAADDSGWLNPLDTGATCPAQRFRTVTWGDGLALVFLQGPGEPDVPEGFASYSYVISSTMTPDGLTTGAGVGLGSTLADVRDAETALTVTSGALGTIAEGADGVTYTVAGPADTDLVTGIAAGRGCVEQPR